jgi:hypothetical protein
MVQYQPIRLTFPEVGRGGFSDTFTLQGASGSSTFIRGDIVVDSLSLGGNSTINMDRRSTTY